MNSRRLLATVAVAMVFALTLVGVAQRTAHAAGPVASLVVDATLGEDGNLTVSETYTLSGEGAPAELVKAFSTRADGIGDIQYRQRIEGLTATVDGAPVEALVQVERDRTVVTVPLAEAGETVVMSYRVIGAVREQGADHVLEYRALQGLNVQVDDVRITVNTPRLALGIDCYAGPPNSTARCLMAQQGTHDAQIPTFQDGPRGPGEQVTIILPFAPDVVAASAIIDHRWTLGGAFSVGAAELLSALALLLVGGVVLFAQHRRAGRDAAAGGAMEKVGEFTPVGAGESEFRHFGQVRPGHVGTVADERVDPIDVTASLLDLAVRGHLRIVELPRAREFAGTDWQLVRRDGSDELTPYEQVLLDAVGDEPALISELASKIQPRVRDIQDALYDEVVEHGWYERRPDQIRNTWVSISLGALVVAVLGTSVLVAFTTFGLLGLAAVAVALGMIFVAQEMPARTRSGSALLAGLQHLSHELHTAPTDQMPQGRELEELSELLPYAVVLGGVDRWIDAIVAADDDEDADPTDLDWYHGPQNWHLQDLPDSLRNFVTTVSGKLFSR